MSLKLIMLEDYIMMNVYKQTIYISIFVSALSFSLALFFWSWNTGWGDFCSNVSIGIFCSICVVIVTVYIQYKSEFKRLFSKECSLLRELYISLIYLNETDVHSMSIGMRIELVNKIDRNFSDLIYNSSEFSCINKEYQRDIYKITTDILRMYSPFIENSRMYPGVALQILKNPKYIEIVSDNIKLASVNKSDKNIAHIFTEEETDI